MQLKGITHASFSPLSGCVRLGNPNFDSGFRILDFPIKREIQKRISTNRNPFPGRISIKGP